MPHSINYLADEFNVHRLCRNNVRDKRNKEIPAVRNFALNAQEDGLSVDAASINTPEYSLGIFGAQYKRNTTIYKDISEIELYPLNIGYIKKKYERLNVIEDPIFFEVHTPGSPDNPAHSLITFSNSNAENQPEIYMMLRDHAIELGVVSVDLIEAQKISEILKSGKISSNEMLPKSYGLTALKELIVAFFRNFFN